MSTPRSTRSPQLVRAYGLAHRGWAIPNPRDTRFGIASGVRPITALVMASPVERVTA